MLGRGLSLFAFSLALIWIVWRFGWRHLYVLDRFPRFTLILHGFVFYGFYFSYFYITALPFDLQTFANWGSIFGMHTAYYLLFSQVEEDTRFFSRTLPNWFLWRTC
jgi:hypothetical protein